MLRSGPAHHASAQSHPLHFKQNGAAAAAPVLTERSNYIGQIFQITPVPGI